MKSQPGDRTRTTYSRRLSARLNRGNSILRGIARTAIAGCLALGAASAQILDTVVFGDSASETAHGLSAPLTQTVTGGLGQPARKLQWDTADTVTKEGGYLGFTAKVDPVQDNYVTLKLWGGDTNTTVSGNLVLYLTEGAELYQVGYRVEQAAEYSPLSWGTVDTPPIPGRFYYTTIPLPLSMTQGKTSAQLRVVACNLNEKGSQPVYRAFVHTGSYFVPAAGEPQATQVAAAPIRPITSDLDTNIAQAKAGTNATINNWLAGTGGDSATLAEAYHRSWTTAYQNPAVVTRVIANIDATVAGYFADPGLADDAWGGSYGPLGDAIRRLGVAAFGSQLDSVIDLGDPAGPATRRVLWSKALKASRDAGRFGRRGPTTNQGIICDKEIYNANKGLQLLGSADAFSETQALRYLREACGLDPWLGPDLPAGGSNSFMGTNYFLVSPQGLTKENGYVSAYGEVYDVVASYFTSSGNTALRDQAAKMLRARAPFRYPMVDKDGHRAFQMLGVLDWRGHQEFPMGMAYGERGGRLTIAAETDDVYAASYVKQMIEDNQIPLGGNDLWTVINLEKIKSQPDSGHRLPNTEGAPDYAWVDVDNGIVAIKRGEELTWIETYWQARTGIHHTGRAMQITPVDARLSHIRIATQIEWNGVSSAIADGVDWNATPLSTPNGLVHQAYHNERRVSGVAPANAQQTREEFIGRAKFYSARYGRYLVGINMHATKSYALKTPAGFVSAVDLVTKETMAGTVTVAPGSAVVLDLGTNVESAPVPGTPKYLAATDTAGGIRLHWEGTGGVASFTVKRATVSGGPYITLAAGIGPVFPKTWGFWPYGSHTDASAATGTTYYYVVSAVNANGESYDSPEAVATRSAASVNSLPAPWSNQDIGTMTTPGSVAESSGTFTVTTAGGDIWNNADKLHFTYQPLIGDGSIVARVVSGSTGKNGVMIRDSLAASSVHADLVVSGTQLKSELRSSSGGGSGNNGGVTTTDRWLKIQRTGNAVTTHRSADGVTWTQVGSVNLVNLRTLALVGLCATNNATFDNITVSSLTTPLGVPAVPAGLAATPGNGNIKLTWQPSDRAASYTVRRSLTSGGPYTTVLATGVTALTYTNNGLSNGTPYYYVVTAVNAAGESAAPAQVSATPVAIPATPGGLNVVTTGTQAVISWNAVSGATSYNVLRSTDGTSWTAVAIGITTTSHANPGLAAGQGYLYQVVAVNANGAGTPTGTFATAAVPLAPLVVRADGSESSGGHLAWTPSGAAASYKVKRATTSGGTYTTVASGLTSASYTDASLVSGDDYYYVVTAVNAAGDSANSNEFKLGWGQGLYAQYFNNTSSTGAPVLTRIDAAPLNVNWGQGSPGSGVNTDNFSVLWDGQIEAPETGTYAFAIPSLDDGVRLWINGSVVLDAAANIRTGSYALTAGQKTTVRGQFWDGTGAALVTVTWTGPNGLTQAIPTSRFHPLPPLAHRASGGTATASTFSTGGEPSRAFDGSTGTKWYNNQNGGTGWLQYQFAGGAAWPIAEYRLTSANDVPQRDPAAWQFQGSNDGSNWTTLDTQAAQTFTARYQTKSYPVSNTTAYSYYRLDITANAGGSGYGIQLSELALMAPLTAPAAPVVSAAAGNQQVTLGWAVVSGATGYKVRRRAHPGAPYSVIATGVTGTSFTDANLANGEIYTYVVSTAIGSLEGPDSTPVTALVAPVPAAPSVVSATAGGTQVTVSWSNAAWATSYTVKRSTTSGGPYTDIATGLTGNSHVNTGLTAGTTYYYVVSSTNASGTGGNSAQASATPFVAAVASASAVSGTTENAAKGFDNSTATKWYSGLSGGTGWIQYQFENNLAKTAVGYVITSANDVSQRDPKDWQFQGSNNGSTWTTLDTRTAQSFSARWQTKLYSVSNSTAYAYYRLNITANQGGSGYGVQLSEFTPLFPLGSPWATSDIGAVGATGAAGSDSGTYTVVGSGAGIAGLADEFRSVYQTGSGNCDVTGRVVTLQNTNGWAKSGVMIRESLNANSAFVAIVVTPGNGVAFQHRASTGAAVGTTQVTGITAPHWVRLARSGNLFTASRSANGTDWTVVGTITVPMSSNVQLGLPLSSHNDGQLSTSTIDQVTATP